MEIDKNKARDIIDKFFSVVPKVKEFLDSLATTGKMRGYIRSAKPYSRIRWFPAWKNAVDNPGDSKSFAVLSEIERQSKNHPIQSTNADTIKAVLCKLYNLIVTEQKWNKVRIVLSVYDEVRCEVPEELAEEWKEIMNKIMVEVAEETIKNVPIVADCTVTDSWEK